MASNILEQVLENLRSGAVLPREVPSTPIPAANVATPVAAEGLDQTTAALLQVLDDELDSFLERTLDLTILRRLPLANDAIREQVITRFSDLATSEIAHATLMLSPETEPSSEHHPSVEVLEIEALDPVRPEAPSADAPTVAEEDGPPELPETDFSDSALDQLRDMLAPINDLPRLLEERLTGSRDGEILEQLGSLSRDLERIRQNPSAPVEAAPSPSADEDDPPAPRPEPQRVALDDIQKMIDFLK